MAQCRKASPMSFLLRTTFVRLWSGEFHNDLSVLPLALLHKPDAEVDGEMISVYAVYFCRLGRLKCLIKPSERDISVGEGALIDVKLSSDKIWILKKDRLVMRNLSGPTETGDHMHIIVSEHEQYFGLQESVVAEQLLQNSEHAADDIFWLAHSVYPYAKEQISTRVSSIFMRFLFLPGIFHDRVLLATFRDLKKHFTHSEFRSLSADGIRKELISLMEHQGASRSPRALLHYWKNFYSRYLHNWSHENAPCGLLLDTSSGAIGLIRKSSISLLRCLEDIELLSFGMHA
ncbi:Nucleoporin Nup120/160 [Artemisia annua]|uniref:Nucleoporin Nup120/160 n=1 Tax=Artemisia annua TaxID=35608 RepID=A0A2U1KNJ3_ARTAN|nr:Nucleoporin Nup120/160 [Artemisia annua]